MGKQGPCRHCGVTSTPLWRNGPPEKPILCNACGSRWRTKGTLVNYTPLHARAEPDDFEEYRVARVKSISIKSKETQVLKRRHSHQENEVLGGFLSSEYCNSNNNNNNNSQGFRKVLDEDTSNRSSSGSAISNSESCVQLCGADASEFSGPVQSKVWDTMVPSRKRTCVSRSKPSSVEKLTKDLCTILQENQSYFSSSSDEDLLFETGRPMDSIEFGHGSVLIRHPNSIAKEEESEASSLSVENNKQRQQQPSNEAYSRLNTLNVNTNNYKGVKFPSPGIEKNKKVIGQTFDQEPTRREKATQYELLQVLGMRNSPLCYIDLQDVVNFEEFKNHLTSEEQQLLLKYLPCHKDGSPLDSFESMFDSPQFKENLSSFQKLLAEGVFDPSISEAKRDGFKTLRRLALCNSGKPKWVEQYNLLKDVKGKSITSESLVGQGLNGRRLRDGQYQKVSGPRTTMKSPKIPSAKANCENKELTESDGNCFSPKSLFALPPDSSSLLLESFQFANENSDQDLLLNVPSHSSFPQAELLFPASSFGGSAQASTSSSSIYQNLVHH